MQMHADVSRQTGASQSIEFQEVTSCIVPFIRDRERNSAVRILNSPDLDLDHGTKFGTLEISNINYTNTAGYCWLRTSRFTFLFDIFDSII